MTLSKPVKDAVAKADAAERKLMDGGTFDGWQTIRAELHRLSEVESRLEAAEKEAQFLRSHRPIARRLEAANALLTKLLNSGHWFDSAIEFNALNGNDLADEIQYHLQGSGDEA